MFPGYIYFSGFLIIAVSAISQHLFEDRKTWHDAIYSCKTKGGRLLTRTEYDFSELDHVISSEFWIGDLVYTKWVSLEGCYHMDTIHVHLKVSTDSKLACFKECFHNGYTYFALEALENTCLCIQTPPRRPQHDVTRCRRICSDGVGICGSDDGHFVSMYKVDNSSGKSSLPCMVSATQTQCSIKIAIKIENHLLYSLSSEDRRNEYDCASTACSKDEYHLQPCDTSLGYICENDDKGHLISTETNWTMAFVNCINNTAGYISGSCQEHKSIQRVWVNSFRGLGQPQAIGSWTDVATAQRCRMNSKAGVLSCTPEPAQTSAKLPYMCLFTADPPIVIELTSTDSSTPKTGLNVTTFPTIKDRNRDLVVVLTSVAVGLSIVLTVVAVYSCFCRDSTHMNNDNKRDENRNIRLCSFGNNGNDATTNSNQDSNDTRYVEDDPESSYQHYHEIKDDNLEHPSETHEYEEPWGCKNSCRPLPDVPCSPASIYV